MTGSFAPLHFHRRDSQRNMARFYRLSMTADLFGNVLLLREWGRIGTRGQQLVEATPDMAAAVARMTGLANAKRRRGYIEVAP